MQSWNRLMDRMHGRPLLALTIIALLPRLLAALFSEGYFAHDDHFLIIEAAQSWVDGFDYNYWLPWNQQGEPTASGHSFFYVGLHFLLFSILDLVGMHDPKANMVAVRLLHAVWSIVAVRAGYRIALGLSDRSIAWNTGLFLALFFFMPFLAVRNLVEVFCIPFLMLSAQHLLQSDAKTRSRAMFMAGLFAGMAINVRFQTLLFAGGVGLAMLIMRSWRNAFLFGLGVVLPVLIIQGGLDLYIWKAPFIELTEYVRYNLEHTTTYGERPVYQYLLVLAGLFIPPFSLLIMFGFGLQARKSWLPWMGVLTFFVIHSLIPNKQERFILPIVPLLFTLGYVGVLQWRSTLHEHRVRNVAWRRIMQFTWAINAVVLVVLTFAYSKRSRCEAMYALRDVEDIQAIAIEDTYKHKEFLLPMYYLGRWDASQWPVTHADSAWASMVHAVPSKDRPNIVLFMGEEDLKARKARMEDILGGELHELGRERPGFVDHAVHWLNPVNRNETIVITRLK